MRKILLLFTGSYPFSAAAENTFVPQEIAVLRKYFDSVTLIPTRTGGGREPIDAPNVDVDVSYAAYIRSWPRRLAFALLALADPAFWAETLPRLPMFARHPRALIRTAHHHVVSRMTERWMRRLRARVSWPDAVLYTWWFDGTTLGLARFAESVKAPVITRAHGYDLYEHRHDPPYIPFRSLALRKVSRVFSASHAGAAHLSARYPDARDRIRTALLGVDDPGVRTPPSTDGVFRIVSCSFLVPVKRIDLLIRGLAEAGRMYPRRQFSWTHIGDGPLRESLAALAGGMLPANVRHERLDYRGREALMAHYATHPADVFINTSSSEGTPVSIMEAISVGIPVIATSVGGNCEIVGPENGLLIPANPQPREIAEAFNALITAPAAHEAMRAGSRTKWEREYSAPANYARFAESVRSL